MLYTTTKKKQQQLIIKKITVLDVRTSLFLLNILFFVFLFLFCFVKYIVFECYLKRKSMSTSKL